MIDPDCYEGLVRGLTRNSRIEKLDIEYLTGTGEFRSCGRSNFLRALSSRPNLKHVSLRWLEDASGQREPIPFDLTPVDIGLFGARELLV
mmetsp:Transcript_15613/g.22959  ORF Transcript_15613/g.22959 Transcript_15613/m.22959 type:complete len:90 (-) Transcript_15613:108-377(-)